MDYRRSLVVIFTGLILLIAHLTAVSQANIFFGKKEIVSIIPPKSEQIRIIIVSDAANEIDDVWAIALAILSPERFKIEGFVGSNFDHTNIAEGHKSIGESVDVIKTILAKAGMTQKYPVFAGGDPMQYEFAPSGSEGVDFIVKKALEGSSKDPLWIVGLGSATDLASAYLKEPSIADKVVIFWHGRTEETWPFRAHNYNVKGDMHAARMLFHSPLQLVLFDTGTKLSAGTLEESQKNVKPYGALGEYLYDYRLKNAYFMDPKKGYFDLGDIAVLVDPDLGKWQETICPTITTYMDYNFYRTNGKFLRCYDIDRDKTFALFYKKLKESNLPK